jgi:3-oxoacyl-[acyl-carrier protein] reductase
VSEMTETVAEPAAPAFHGQVALVTGASSGIGAATARLLAQRGAAVAVNYRRSEKRAKSLVEELCAQGAAAVAVGADVTDSYEVHVMIDKIEAALGSIDVLVLNATGLYGDDVRVGTLLNTSPYYVEWVVQRQIRAVLNPIHSVLPGMLVRQRGSIVAVGAALSRTPTPGFLSIAMAKATVEVAVRTLAKEVAPFGVRVNAVAPGVIRGGDNDELPTAAQEASTNGTLIQRPGRPQDVAEAIAFLASAQADYFTGAYLCAERGPDRVR